MILQTENTQVVIVGGDPAGMMLACELTLAEIKVILIEKRTEPVKESRAATLHPRTMEVFAARGISDRFISKAEQILGKDPRLPGYHFAGISKLRFDKLDSRFNYTLFLQQTYTESLLEERAIELGAEIRRGHEVVNFIDRENGVEVYVKSDTKEYIINAQYIVGCDGGGSLVRKTAKIDFPGTDSDRSLFLADVEITRPLLGGKIFKSTNLGMVMALPLDSKLVRFAIIHINDMLKGHKESITLDEVKKCLKDICGDDYGVHSPVWLSRFGNANRLATNYRKGRFLLAGDAAHIHLPAGGQGLNYAIQDAFNLGWKLAAVINKWSSDNLLDSYHNERHKIGECLMENVKRQEALMTNFSPSGLALRRFFDEVLLEIEEVNKKISIENSGLYVSYPSSNPNGHILDGKRMIDLKLIINGKEKYLYDILFEGKFVLLILKDTEFKQSDKSFAWLNVVRANLNEDRADYNNLTAILIRPDAHIATAFEDNNITNIDVALRNAMTV